jgi:hypothetical protein
MLLLMLRCITSRRKEDVYLYTGMTCNLNFPLSGRFLFEEDLSEHRKYLWRKSQKFMYVRNAGLCTLH